MAYTPIDNGSFVPGTLGSAAVWNSLIGNDAALYAEAVPVYAGSCNTFSTTATSATAVAYFALPANRDDNTFSITFVYGQTGSSGTVTFELHDGSATDSATTTVTAASGSGVVSLTPSSTSASDTPRWGVLKMHTTSGQTFSLSSWVVYLVPSAAAAGVLASSYASVSTTWSVPNAPIPSKVMATLENNPKWIARDRPNALYSYIAPITTVREGVYTNSTDYVTTLRPFFCKQQHTTKKYRMWCYVERDGTAKANVLMVIGGQNVYVLDDYGVMTTTFEASGSTMNAMSYANTISIRVSSGSGYVSLKTLQVIEEPY
tara:strand:- start:3418 stop:4368 length:951 start_codon:yes stop_codon:yes gene_type:complete